MLVEGLLPANLWLVTFKLGTMFAIWKIPPATRSNYKQNIQFKFCFGNSGDASTVNRNPIGIDLFHVLDFPLQITARPIMSRGAGTLPWQLRGYVHCGVVEHGLQQLLVEGVLRQTQDDAWRPSLLPTGLERRGGAQVVSLLVLEDEQEVEHVVRGLDGVAAAQHHLCVVYEVLLAMLTWAARNNKQVASVITNTATLTVVWLTAPFTFASYGE